MTDLPISNFVNVSILTTPSGLTETNVNSIGLFTTENPLIAEDYGIYISPSQVANSYGTNSVTAKMADALFAQSPNIRSGNGQLVILPLLDTAVNATQGKVQTPDISANLASLIAVSSGDLRVTLNGTVLNYTGINLTTATTLAGVAAILQKFITDAVVTSNATTITVTSKKNGTASTVALGAVSGGSGTDLSGVSYLKGGTATATAGTASSGETINQAITRTEGLVSYTAVMTNLEMDDTVIASTADFIQARDLLFYHHFSSSSDIAGIATTIKNSADKKTRSLLYTPSLSTANIMKAGYVGRLHSVDFTGSNTVSTMHLKQLASVLVDDGITQTMLTNSNIAGIDTFAKYKGVPCVFSTGGNDFADNQYVTLALKTGLETAIFNTLRQTNTKVPQTEAGMNSLAASIAKICEQFVRNGTIAPNEWNSSDTFGNPEIFRENIRNKGYYIWWTPIKLQNSTDRELRKAPLIQVAVKYAGAIHYVNTIVNINY